MTIWKPLAFFLFFICSCQSSLNNAKAKNSPIEDFIFAKSLVSTDKKAACDSFVTLAGNKDFILNDVAHIKSLAVCEKEKQKWDRELPAWLEKEKQLAAYEHLDNAVDKAVFITKNPQYFPSPDRIKAYQAALRDPAITEENKLIVETALYSIAPRFMPQPQVKDYFAIVKDLRSIREFEKAREYLRKIIRSSSTSMEDKWLAHKEIFFTDKLQRLAKKDVYIKSAKAWADFIKPSKALSPTLLSNMYEAKLNYARVLWTERGAEAAIPVMDKIRKDMQGKVSIYDVYWLKARMLEEKKKSDLAVAEYEKALKEKIPVWRDQEKILWNLAWTYFKLKKYDMADKHLQSLIDGKETSAWARFKYTYWQAESRKALGSAEEALALWKKLSDEDIFGYYGMIALHQQNLPLRPITPAENLPRGIAEKDDLVFKALQVTQEWELASRFLASVLPDTASLKKAPASDIASIFKLYAEVHNYKYIFSLFNQLPFEGQRDVFEKVPFVLFPQPYQESITKAAQAANIESALIYSIMRQESSFDPQARSPMDALGLTQVLPEVAKKIASETNIPFSSYEDLYDTDKNILIGSYLLKRQSQQFDNKFPLLVASYNASGSAVRQWQKRHTGSELMFIEDIPYEETKTYVKLVMRNFVLYKKIQQGDLFASFPSELLTVQ